MKDAKGVGENANLAQDRTSGSVVWNLDDQVSSIFKDIAASEGGATEQLGTVCLQDGEVGRRPALGTCCVGFSRLMCPMRRPPDGPISINHRARARAAKQGVVRASRLALDPPATQCVNPARFCVIASQLPMHARNIEGDRHFARNDRANKVSTATGIRRGSSDVILQHYTTIPGLYVPTSSPTLHTGICLLRRCLAASLEAGRPSRHRQPARANSQPKHGLASTHPVPRR
jgi:hypothetical protein